MTAPEVRPLHGIRVIDLTHVLAGPYATYQLALLGAEVVKIEMPGGEWMRRPAEAAQQGLAAGFVAQAGGKRMTAIDIRKPEGAALVKAMIPTADVFVENLTPGVAAGYGLGPDVLQALNPRLVYTSITGFGQDGPFASRPAYDHVIQAMSGLMSMTGTPESGPLRVGPPMVDYLTGIHAAFAIMAGLAARDRTGVFQRIDVAMLDCAFAGMSSTISAHLNAGATPRASGNTPASDSPSGGVFPTGDGLLALAANTERQFASLCMALDRPHWQEDPRFRARSERSRNAAALRAAIADALATDTAAGWEKRLMAADIPAGWVRSIPQAVSEPHAQARGTLHASGGAKVFGTAFKLNGESLAPQGPTREAGADTEAVLRELGYDATAIDDLARKGVVGLG